MMLIKTYDAYKEYEFAKDTILTASWDEFPKLSASNRYFTLEQAQKGEITEAELLRTVVATDKEDGTLKNGVDVTLKDYNLFSFIMLMEGKEFDITYEAKDSFGNVVVKKQKIYVVDTSMEIAKKQYVRFINKNFLLDLNGNLNIYENGGLEENSIWRTNENYRTLLKKALLRDDAESETWMITAEELKRLKEKSPAD